MKRLALLGVVSLALITTAAPAGAAPSVYRLQGTINTTVVFNPTGPLMILGSGVVAPLGSVTAVSHQTVSGNPLAPAVGDVISSTDLRITTVAGDSIHGGYTMYITRTSPTAIAFTGWVHFSGGTGRFAGATGGARSIGGYSFPTNTGFYTLDGAVVTGA